MVTLDIERSIGCMDCVLRRCGNCVPKGESVKEHIKDNTYPSWCPISRPSFPEVLGELGEIFCDGKWYRGRIVDDFRFREGIVTIETDDGQRVWCPTTRYELYRKVEE